MSEDWDDHAAGRDGNAMVRAYADQAMASLIKHIDVRDSGWRSKCVLDSVCGTGFLTEKLPRCVGNERCVSALVCIYGHRVLAGQS